MWSPIKLCDLINVLCYTPVVVINNTTQNVSLYSDASDISFGGYIVGTPINIFHGMWFGVERGNSSTWK
jgi:hypothetical protein